jgi:hypothetical protein
MSSYIKKDDTYNLALDYGSFSMAAIVEDMPTIDIVRCGECEHTHRVDDHEIWCTGRGSPCQLVAPDGFCDKGKARVQE